MSENQRITELTPKQKALIPIYQEKWRQIAFSTERIDKKKATEAIKAVCRFIGQDEPEIIFFDDISSAIEECKNNPNFNRLKLEKKLFRRFDYPLILD